jgi:type IV pilus assembly protein PilM
MGLMGSMFGSKYCPIGVDLGSDCLKLAQVAPGKGSSRELVAAVTVPVPDACRRDAGARINFFRDQVRGLLARGSFRGRDAVLALPASCMYIERLRLPKLDDEQIKSSIQWEARGKLPIDPSQALMRHVVAGEVFQDQEPLNEVIVMAASRELMNRLLSAAAAAKLNVVGMTAEPQATVDCFIHQFSGTPQAGLTRMIVDIGNSATRVYIARGPQLLFARSLAAGAEHLNQAVATGLKIPLQQAREMRFGRARPAAQTKEKGSAQFPLAVRDESGENEVAGASTSAESTAAAVAAAPARPAAQANPIDVACSRLVAGLIDDLEMCVRYHESTFPTCAVEQLVLVGGEANNSRLARQIASHLELPMQTGDPLKKLVNGRSFQGLDTTRPQPAWTVAVGLSLGTVA